MCCSISLFRVLTQEYCPQQDMISPLLQVWIAHGMKVIGPLWAARGGVFRRI